MILLPIPVIAAATLYSVNWFSPAFAVIAGAHSHPFVSLYGMREYAALAAALVAGGVVIAYALPEAFGAGGWFGAGVLLAFGTVVWYIR